MFAGIDQDHRWWSWKRILFALSLFSCSLFEPAQALYALVPIAFLVVFEFATEVIREGAATASRGRSRPRPRWACRLRRPGAFFAAEGILGPTFSYYKALTLASSAYAFPSQVDSWVTHPATLESFIFWAVPVTLALGVTGLFMRGARQRSSSAVVVALGLLGLMLMQKQILRPHAATQIWLPLVFGLVYWAVSDTLLAPARRWAVVLAASGGAAALVLVSGGYHQGWKAVEGGPSRCSAAACTPSSTSGPHSHDRQTSSSLRLRSRDSRTTNRSSAR